MRFQFEDYVLDADRRELVVHVVGDGQHRHADVLGPPGERSEPVGVVQVRCLQREPEGAGGTGHVRRR